MPGSGSWALILCVALALPLGVKSFVGTWIVLRSGCFGASTSCLATARRPLRVPAALALTMQSRGGRGGGRGGRGGQQMGPGKKAGRMGKMVQQELMSILRGVVSRNCEDDLLRNALQLKVSIVDVEMTPDVKVAKVHISVIGEDILQKEIVAWMQENTKSIRYELAQNMKHLRTVPTLQFVSADVGAAMDVMSILEGISRERALKEAGLPVPEMPPRDMFGRDEEDSEEDSEDFFEDSEDDLTP